MLRIAEADDAAALVKKAEEEYKQALRMVSSRELQSCSSPQEARRDAMRLDLLVLIHGALMQAQGDAMCV